MPSVVACTCFPVPEKYWTTHYGAVDPATMLEHNPDCPEHGDGPRHLARGRLAVRLDPRTRNPHGWAVVSNEPVPHWIGTRRTAGPFAGLFVYLFKSWHSAVLRVQREAERRRNMADKFCSKAEDCRAEFHRTGCFSWQRVEL